MGVESVKPCLMVYGTNESEINYSSSLWQKHKSVLTQCCATTHAIVSCVVGHVIIMRRQSWRVVMPATRAGFSVASLSPERRLCPRVGFKSLLCCSRLIISLDLIAGVPCCARAGGKKKPSAVNGVVTNCRTKGISGRCVNKHSCKSRGGSLIRPCRLSSEVK